MKLLKFEEANAWFISQGMRFQADRNWFGQPLSLVNDAASIRKRVAARPLMDIGGLAGFLADLNALLPNPSQRLLWVERIEHVFPSQLNAFNLLRRPAFGDEKIEEYPGHIFGAFDFSVLDISEMSGAQICETETLVSLLLLILAGGWDAKLVAGMGDEAVEIWEGNIIFYSSEKQRLDTAEAIFKSYNLFIGMK